MRDRPFSAERHRKDRPPPDMPAPEAPVQVGPQIIAILDGIRRLERQIDGLAEGLGQRLDGLVGTLEQRIGSPADGRQALPSPSAVQAGLSGSDPPPPSDPLDDPAVIRQRAEQTLREIAPLHVGVDGEDDRLTAASKELDAIVRATEAATHAILAAAESIEQIVADITSSCPNAVVAEQVSGISVAVARIFEASNFQDITGQRIAKVVKTLEFVDDRVATVVTLWGADAVARQADAAKGAEVDEDRRLLNGPQLEDRAITQDEIDALFD